MSSKARSVYISSPEGETGKSTIALGVVDLLSRQVQRVGVFRPITRNGANSRDEVGERDYVLELLLAHDGVDLSYDQCTGATYAEVHHDPEAALANIVARYREMERNCDAVVIVGSDYTDVAGPTELAFNARIAANLGAPVLLVLSGNGRSPEGIRQLFDVSVSELSANYASVMGTIVNRCLTGSIPAVQQVFADVTVPTWTVPEEPFLTAPTVQQLMRAVGGELVNGDDELLGREVLDVLVGAMTFDHLLEKLVDGAVVITPGDRVDVLLGLLVAQTAKSFPSLAGIILNGGFYPRKTSHASSTTSTPPYPSFTPHWEPSAPLQPPHLSADACPKKRNAKSTQPLPCSNKTLTPRRSWLHSKCNDQKPSPPSCSNTIFLPGRGKTKNTLFSPKELTTVSCAPHPHCCNVKSLT